MTYEIDEETERKNNELYREYDKNYEKKGEEESEWKID